MLGRLQAWPGAQWIMHIMTCHDPLITPGPLLTAMHCMPAQVAKPQKPPQVLQGNAGEVTGVAWCSTDTTQIVTCHDNATVNVWTLDRSRDPVPGDLVRIEITLLICACVQPCLLNL
jgi:hypothetical protein